MSGWRPRAVLFDCDGVLIDSEAITNRLMLGDLAERGLELTLPEMLEISVGGTMEAVAAECARRGAQIEQDWVAQFYGKAFAALAEQVEEIPGASDLIDRLGDAGIEMAVGSNGPIDKMKITLGRTGLWDRLAPHIYSAKDLGRPKPEPDIYLHAAEAVGIAAPDCIVIEDSAPGAKAAKAAGMRCIGFARDMDATKLVPFCDIVATDMAEVAKVLGV